jgi:initiation factor 1A
MRAPFAEYAKVLKMLGNGRLEAYCYDGITRLCHIRGKMRKQVWVAVVRACAVARCGRLSGAEPWCARGRATSC